MMQSKRLTKKLQILVLALFALVILLSSLPALNISDSKAELISKYFLIFIFFVFITKRQTFTLKNIKGFFIFSAILVIIGVMTLVYIPKDTFEACMSIGDNESINDVHSCDKSWQKPFSEKTRHDSSINYHQLTKVPASISGIRNSNWNISSLNDLQYNLYATGEINQDRLSIKSNWTADIGSSNEYIVIRYIGGVKVQSDGQLCEEMSYNSLSTLKCKVNPGKIEIQYSWSRIEGEFSEYAAIQVYTKDGNLLRANGHERQIYLRIADSVTTATAAVFILFCLFGNRGNSRRILQNQISYLLFICLINIAIVSQIQNSEYGGLYFGPFLTSLGLLVLLQFNEKYVSWDLAKVAVFISVCITGLHANLERFYYREPGGDSLTYESFARTILNHRSLHGGEDIYAYSPGIRYLKYLERLFFGDFDIGIYALYSVVTLLIIMNMMIKTSFFKIHNKPTAKIITVRLILMVPLLLLTCTSFYQTAPVKPLSEYPVWLATLAAMAILVRGQKNDLTICAILMGIAIWFRVNIIPGAIFMIIYFYHLYPDLRLGFKNHLPQVARSLVLLMALPYGLVLIHNWHYGDSLIGYQTSVRSNLSFPFLGVDFNPQNLSAEVIPIFVNQLVGLFAWRPSELPLAIYVAFKTIQIFGMYLILNRWFKNRSDVVIYSNKWLWFLGIVFLLPHLVLQVWVYYPRHIIAGYLVFALALASSKLETKPPNARSTIPISFNSQ